MTPAVNTLLVENLKALKLSTMVRHLEAHLRQATENHSSYEEFLLNLTEDELRVRADNRLKRRLREARFPLMKPMETFDFDSTPQLDVRLIKELAGGEYVRQARNVIFLGKSGTGKTHLATALGIEACRQDLRTRFVTGCGLVNELIEARDEKLLGRTMKRYAACDLLILDELGYVPFSQQGAELLFQILAERHERKSVIITSNMGFAEWTQIFGDAHLTAALLDRVTHKAWILNCTWDSYRLKETLQSIVPP